MIAERNLGARVRLIGRIDEDQLVEHLARCRAVCFTPYDEDYGFVTVEAFSSRKAVITCSDSGGPAELVNHGVTGRVVPPTADALATALREITDDLPLAERLGGTALEHVAAMTWERAVQRLLQQ